MLIAYDIIQSFSEPVDFALELRRKKVVSLAEEKKDLKLKTREIPKHHKKLKNGIKGLCKQSNLA